MLFELKKRARECDDAIALLKNPLFQDVFKAVAKLVVF